MKYGIVGSRKRTDKAEVINFIKTLNPEDIIISGGCKGVDLWAELAAKQRNLKTIIYLPDLKNCSKKYEYIKAYYARNKQIAETCDILVAFVDPSRKGGTENTIKYAQKANKKIILL